MSSNFSDVIEWHILENTVSKSSTPEQGLHMGPFSSEQECRNVLADLKQIPWFRHSALEVHKKCKRREKRRHIRLAVRVSRLSASENTWVAHTVDVSNLGARLSDFDESVHRGEFLEIRCGQKAAVFRVVWVGAVGTPGTPATGHIGVECLSPETNLWELNLSARADGEHLQEIAIARSVQRQLLPRHKPTLRTLEYSAKCIEAGVVSGDYYDFLDLGPGRVGFVLADVAGKGVPAALLMANLHGCIHNRAGLMLGDLPGMLAALNEHLYRHTDPDRYATLFFGCYDDDSRSLAYVNCGHTPPLLLRSDGSFDRLGATATVLGLLGSWECTLAQAQIGPGDLLGLFTDGVTEATASNGEEFGEERLLQVLQKTIKLESAAILGHVEHAVAAFRSSARMHDDLTMVFARGR
ncbi:MAG: PP2C family protein-serine/threonine phosphatase [Candidatus Sulfotelmatobacter sp.]